MAEKKREPFGRRIYNACRALRGEPWPQEVIRFEYLPRQEERRDIKTLLVGVEFHEMNAKQMDPDQLREHVTSVLSGELAHTLAAEGAVEIAREVRGGATPWERYTRFTGRLQVVMPKKKEEDNNAD